MQRKLNATEDPPEDCPTVYRLEAMRQALIIQQRTGHVQTLAGPQLKAFLSEVKDVRRVQSFFENDDYPVRLESQPQSRGRGYFEDQGFRLNPTTIRKLKMIEEWASDQRLTITGGSRFFADRC